MHKQRKKETLPGEPSYLSLFRSGELKRRAELIGESLKSCTFCLHSCKINRLEKKGKCRFDANVPVASHCVHKGEEPVLTGNTGVANIFLVGCSLRCVYCQNFEISQTSAKHTTVTVGELASIMMQYQNQGCRLLGFVNPTHAIHSILQSLVIACQQGFSLPLIYNTHAYDSISLLKMLDGIFDIYLPDFKYGCEDAAVAYSSCSGYVQGAFRAIKEMHRQLRNDWIVDLDGFLRRGLLIRYLVLPNDLSCSKEVFRMIASIDRELHVSIMSQYYPAYQATNFPLLERNLRESEYDKAIELFFDAGLQNGFIQEPESESNYRPDFQRLHPFEDIE